MAMHKYCNSLDAPWVCPILKVVKNLALLQDKMYVQIMKVRKSKIMACISTCCFMIHKKINNCLGD